MLRYLQISTKTSGWLCLATKVTQERSIDGNVRDAFTESESFILQFWKFLFPIPRYARPDCIFQKSEMLRYLQIYLSDCVVKIKVKR